MIEFPRRPLLRLHSNPYVSVILTLFKPYIDEQFFPEELMSIISSTKPSVRKAKRNSLPNLDLSKLDELEKEEIDGTNNPPSSAKEKAGEGGGLSDEGELDEEDEDDGEDFDNDYQIDYYDEDLDAFGNSDGEMD
jgi:hypothetical protein